MKRISELVLYKDHHLIALNKPAGLPVQEDKTGDPSAHRMAMAYAHRDLYLVHRLDRRVSGVVVFAKTKEAAALMSKQWEENKVKKIYLGIVPTADIPAAGQLKHYLTYDNKLNITYTSDEPKAGADEALLHYQVLQQFDNFMLLPHRPDHRQEASDTCSAFCIGCADSRRHQVWFEAHQSGWHN
ncbi:MAG: RNA pseudouridine synthase [Saprospiraceae bacterium]|nr:RNA pseudouridine synthase [Candidatus Opimibacter iunctus]